MSSRWPAARACVFTVLTGNYEPLLEQPMALESALPFICFTDTHAQTSDTWQIRPIEPTILNDPSRSSRVPKIAAHRYLPEFDVSLYIDNSVLLTAPAEVALDELLPEGAVMGAIAHTHRQTLGDEFDAVRAAKRDTAAKIDEQRERYLLADPTAMELPVLCGGILARRHHDPLVAATMHRWLAHVMRYSRRDQLSLPVVLKQTGLDVNRSRVDIRQSAWHQWPIPELNRELRGTNSDRP